MKKNVLRLIDIEVAKLRKSINKLDAEAAAMVGETISQLEALRQEAEAAEDVVGVDDMVNRMRDIVDEKINAALEKVKDVREVANSAKGADFLKSENSVHEWAQAIRESRSVEQFREKWGAILSTNGITIEGGEEGFLPAAVKSKIEDKWNSDTNWLRYLNNTGAKRFALRMTEQEQDDISVRAKGHTKGNKKTAQEVTLSAKMLATQAIYKFQTVDNQTIYDDDAALIEWVVDELNRQMYYEVGRAILVGDGRQAGDTDAITSIEAIARQSGDAFVEVHAGTPANDLMSEFMEHLIAPIYNGEDMLLFVGKSDLFELRKQIFATGGTTRYASIDELKDMMGVRDIVVVPYLDATTQGAPRAIAMHPGRYYTVGNLQDMNFVTFPDHWQNTENYRAEAFVGGGVALNCASVYINA